MEKKRKSSQKMKKLTVQESDAVILQFQRNWKKRGYLFCQKEKENMRAIIYFAEVKEKTGNSKNS